MMPHLPPPGGNLGRSSGIRGVLIADISPGVGHLINYKCACALSWFLVSCILSERMEATVVKKVLVSVGENRHIVSFSSKPGFSDAEILSKAIKACVYTSMVLKHEIEYKSEIDDSLPLQADEGVIYSPDLAYPPSPPITRASPP